MTEERAHGPAATLDVLEDGADDERLDTVTRHLREELGHLDVGEVVPARGGTAPAGSKGFDVVAVGGLLLAVANSTALRAVVMTVRGWLGRSPQPDRKVRLEVDGDVLELSGASSAEQDRLVELFVARSRRRPRAVPCRP